MGLVFNSLKFLLEAHRSGVRFDETVTLGQQHMTISPERILSLLREYDLGPPPNAEAKFLSDLRAAQWRFGLFAQQLGAKNISAMDISGYEKANIVHDLNVPIPANLQERFDLLIDGGTLEHVFNVPASMESCMRMVKTGGHVVIITNINNMVGHGFYQFSPEFFYRVFSKDNGFQVTRMVALEDGFARSSLFGVKYDFPIQGDWFEVHDPDKIRKRNLLMTLHPTVLFVLAKKVSNAPIFKTAPQQSEYPADDQSVLNPSNQNRLGGLVIGWLRRSFPESIWREWLPRLAAVADPVRRWRYRRANSFENRDFYTRTRR